MAQALTTTTNTLDQHILGISMNGLPQTIQDAIEVTRRLKLRYLWVDSLCILQDSEDDKAVEIAKMEKIYQDAYITISAAGPSDCTLGFLGNLADPLPMRMAPIILPFRAEDDTVSTCSLYEQFSENMRASLHKRAWTMQEHLLSPRLLVFSTWPVLEVFWYCRMYLETPEAEAGFGIRSSRGEWKKMHELLSPPNTLSHDDNDEARRNDQLRNLELIWKGVMEEYSSRRLTQVTDRLPALSGLVTAFQPYVAADYVAGIWSRWLVRHLVWKVVKSDCSRPAQLSCPTWSWLSVDGSIELSLFHGEARVIARGVEVCECWTTPLDEKVPFGQIREWALRIQGHLQQVNLEKDSTNTYKCLPCFPNRAASEPAYVRLDTVDEHMQVEVNYETSASYQVTYWCMPLMEYIPQNAGWAKAIEGLVLSLTCEDYRRIGWFSCNRGWDGSSPLFEASSIEPYYWVFDCEKSAINIK
jgi:hypothetical protein